MALAALLIVALLGGCAALPDATSSEKGTVLTVRAWPNGMPKQPVREWTLVCPAGGTLPRAARACRLLERLPNAFTRVPGPRACTQIYGGPAEAIISGVFNGRRVSASFSRGDGCRIAEWNKVAFLFPGVAHG